MPIESVCVYCASSSQIDPDFVESTRELARELVSRRITVVYGAGSVGLMGTLADTVLELGGRVVGVIPKFMEEREWHHPRISKTFVVQTMAQRKAMMLELADAFITLPGGPGTLEEFSECLSHRRLELHRYPIWVANWKGYYDPLVAQLRAFVSESFVESEFDQTWSAYDTVPAMMEELDRVRT